MIGGDLLATKRRRFVAFFFLYITVGLPFGFSSTALTTQLRRAGVSPAAIGALVSTLYLPWAFKWIFGPFIDLVYSERLGRRRAWIVALQLLMSGALLVAMAADFTHSAALFSLNVRVPGTQYVLFSLAPSLFSLLILIYNTFGAMQAVAIDALACNVLDDTERDLAGGLMSAGIYVGIAIGGAGVLYFSDFLGHRGSAAAYSFTVPAACALLITLLVSLRLKEKKGPERVPGGSMLRDLAARVAQYARDAARALFGSRSAVMALCVALLPMGAQAFALGWRSTLAVELGMRDSAIASLAVCVEVISAGCCVLGGYLANRLGRRRMLAFYITCNAFPNLALVYLMHRHGWSTQGGGGHNPAVLSGALLVPFWAANLVYAVFQGFYSGTRMALFMAICIPAVAATQFSAYVSLNSFGSGYLAVLLGSIVSRWGYPTMLAVDALLGLLCLVFLPFMRAARSEPTP